MIVEHFIIMLASVFTYNVAEPTQNQNSNPEKDEQSASTTPALLTGSGDKISF